MRNGKDLEQQFATIADVFAYFESELEKAALPAPERTQPATQWHIELPLFDAKDGVINNRVNMLRASLPPSLQRSLAERVQLLRNELQSSHVVQAAVSGGGKVLFCLFTACLCIMMHILFLRLLDTNSVRIVRSRIRTVLRYEWRPCQD